jgi:hypothetical protein
MCEACCCCCCCCWCCCMLPPLLLLLLYCSGCCVHGRAYVGTLYYDGMLTCVRTGGAAVQLMHCSITTLTAVENQTVARVFLLHPRDARLKPGNALQLMILRSCHPKHKHLQLQHSTKPENLHEP